MQSNLRHSRLRRVRTVVFLICCFLLAPALAPSQDVLTYRNDNARTGQYLNETLLTPNSVNPAAFGKLVTFSVDGMVDGQPLYVSSVSIPSKGAHNVLIVVTEHDSVYAFDADTGAVIWHVSVLKAGETTSDARSCGQVAPELGITSTPVIDRAGAPNGVIYVVALSKDTSDNYFQRLHALDLATGGELFGGPTTVKATRPGTGNASSGEPIVFDPAQYTERAGLLLLNGVIYTAWEPHCDIRPYAGWIIGYDARTLAQTSVLQVTPGGSGVATSSSGAGLAADGSGNIYFLDGAGDLGTTLGSNALPTSRDLGNPVTQLATRSGLPTTDYIETCNQLSGLCGAMAPGPGAALLLPDMRDSSGTVQHLAVGGGKDTDVYIINRDYVDQLPSNSDLVYQHLTGALPGGLWSMPAYFNNRLYFGSADSPISAFQFANATLSTEPVAQTGNSFAYPGASPSISASSNTNGIVWATDNVNPAVLHAYDSNNLNELYDSSQASVDRDTFCSGNTSTAPTIANGKVYVASGTCVGVFGLLTSGVPAGVSLPPLGFSNAPQSLTVSGAEKTTGATIGPTTEESALSASSPNRADDCSTAANTSMGSGWTMAQCQGTSSNPPPTDPTSISLTTTNSVGVGHWIIAAIQEAGGYGEYLYASDSLGNVAAGMVTTNGTEVAFSSGLPFSLSGCSSISGTRCYWNGKKIVINGTSYTISTVNSVSSITLTTSAGVQSTPVAYSGPGWWCSDTDGDVSSSIQAVCAAYVSTGGSDTITGTCSPGGYHCGGSDQYVFILNITEISNAKGVGSLDFAACARAGCAVAGGRETGLQTTIGSNPSVASQVITPSGANELIFVEAGYGVGPVYQPSGWYGLIIGTAGANVNNQYCGLGNGYCTNEAQTQVIVRAPAGSYAAQQDDGATSDDYVIQTLAFTAGAGSSPALVSIAVTPVSPTIAKGLTQQFAAIGTYSDSSTQNLTSTATWSSTNAAVATISAAGLATGVAAGTSNITAGLNGVTSPADVLTVTAVTLPVLVSVVVTPANAAIAAGGTQQYTATGTYSDASTQNLTGTATWSSTSAATATINSAGLATGVASGTTTIQATSGSVSGSTGLTVGQTIPGLVGWWKFDDGSGTAAVDSSGNNYTATLFSGITWTAGNIGDAITANGTNQYGMTPSINLSGTNAVTVAMWLKRTYTTSGGHTLLEASSNYNNSTTGFGLFPDDSSCHGIQASVHGNVGYSVNCYSQPSSGVWHHLAVVYDKSQSGGNVVAVYIDGVLQTATQNLNTTTNTNDFGANPIYLFSRGGTQEFSAGSMDDLRLYNHALSASEIQQIYNQ